MDFCQIFEILYTFCNLFVFSFYRMGFLVKVSDLLEKLHQICWFSGCDLPLPDAPGLRKPLAILQCHKESSVIDVFLKSFCRFFEKFVVFCVFSLYRLAFLSKVSAFHEKNPSVLLVFWLKFSPPSEKICTNLCIPKKIWSFSENSAPFLCSQDTKEHAASGWCAAVICWKKSTRFAGFLAVIFTSQ